MYLSKNNFNSGHEPSLKIYGYLLSKLSIESYQNNELICDRDSWVLLWNELNVEEGEKKHFLGSQTSQFLQDVPYKNSPVLFLTPIPLSTLAIELAHVGLYLTKIEVYLPVTSVKQTPKFYYKFPQYGWMKKRHFESNKRWVEVNFKKRAELEEFLIYYQLIAGHKWHIVTSHWHWSPQIILGFFQSYLLDTIYRYNFHVLKRLIKSVFKGRLVFFCQFVYFFV